MKARPPAGGSLAPRLLAAFVAVALLGIVVLAVLVAGGLRVGAQRVLAAERQQIANSVARSAQAAYEGAGGWAGADLSDAVTQAACAGALMIVRDGQGERVEATANVRMGHAGGPPITSPVFVDGARVGVVILRFASDGGVSGRTVATLWMWIAAAAVAALVVAVVVAVVVTRYIARPLQHLARAVTRVGAGDRDVALRSEDFPGELGQVAEAVTVLARDLDAQDRLRRAALADATHELRTPVAVLQAYLEEMVDGVSDPDPQRLALLYDEVLRIGRLINDLEVLREAETVGLRLSAEPVDLAQVAARAADVLAGPAAEEGVVVERRLAQAWVQGDPARLTQVVMNLLTNALKHGGGAAVEIMTAETDAGAVLEVVDHGQGIREADLPHVFERYWRGDARTEGSGVGLTVVREIVTAHRGRVSAQPTQGGGATIRVVLPSCGCDASAAPPPLVGRCAQPRA